MFLQDPPGYWIEDTSTNGTLINGDRIPKGTSAPLKEEDRVQLSWNAAGEAAALLEYGLLSSVAVHTHRTLYRLSRCHGNADIADNSGSSSRIFWHCTSIGAAS